LHTSHLSTSSPLFRSKGCPTRSPGNGCPTPISWKLVPDTNFLELAVVAFLQRVEQVCGRVHLAVVLDLLIALRLDDAAIVERERSEEHTSELQSRENL